MVDINQIINGLRTQHGNAVCELDYNTPFELLVAVILSAQCTDKRVNIITKELFKVYNQPQQFANLAIEELIPYIKSCGYYSSKGRAIIESAQSIMQNFNGNVPTTIEELMTLRGVGKKTANVVYSVAFGGDAIAVDTHVFRVSNRIGIVDAKNVADTEKQLMQIVPQANWSEFHHLLIHHGRYVCNARQPKCDECIINQYCKKFTCSNGR